MDGMRPKVGAEVSEQRLRALLDVGRALVSDFDLEAVLVRVLEAGRELTGARYAALGVLDERGEALERFLTSGIDQEERQAIGPLPRGRGVLGVLIRDPRPLRLADVGSHAHSYGFPPGHPPMRTFLGVPIRIRNEIYGNLYLTEKEGGVFDDSDEESVIVLAEWAAIAVENARAYTLAQGRSNELERAMVSFEATTEIAEALAGETDLDHVLELIAKRARALTEARAVVVLLRAGEQLVVAALAGELDRSLVGQSIPIDGSVSGQVLRSGESERLADAPSRLRFALAEQTQAKTGLFVPLRLRGRVLGVLSAFDRLSDDPQFSARDEQLLSAFASSAAAAVATAQDVRAQALQRSIAAAEEERKRWARELHDETLQELAALKLLLATARITKDDAQREQQLTLAVERINIAVQALRDLITDLRPASLDELGLEAALGALAERVTRTSKLDVEVDIELASEFSHEPTRLPAELEDAIYRVAQEGLSNVVKHAVATRAEIIIRERNDLVELVVVDNGEGFDVEGTFAGYGLLGIRERLALVGGAVEIESSDCEGTTLRANFPRRRSQTDLSRRATGG